MIPEKAQGKVNEAKVVAIGPGGRGKVGGGTALGVGTSGERCYRKGQENEGELEVSTRTERTQHTAGMAVPHNRMHDSYRPLVQNHSRMHHFVQCCCAVHRMERWSL